MTALYIMTLTEHYVIS